MTTVHDTEFVMLHFLPNFSKEDVEKCKQKDLLEQTMSEMIGEFPALHQTIVAERDIYLTHTMRQATRCVEAPPNAQSKCYTVSRACVRLTACPVIGRYTGRQRPLEWTVLKVKRVCKPRKTI